MNAAPACAWCGARHAGAFVAVPRHFLEVVDCPVANTPIARHELWMQCRRCGHRADAPATLSTLRPVVTAAPAVERVESWRALWLQDLPAACAPSVAYDLGLLTPRENEDRFDDSDVSRRPGRWWDEAGECYVGPFRKLAPVLSGAGEGAYDYVLENLVELAMSADELIREIGRFFITLRWAFAAGDGFAATEVADAGTNILGVCLDCGAWPGERHMLSENPDCPTTLEGWPQVFWGHWTELLGPRAPGAARTQAIIEAARVVLGELQELVDVGSPATRVQRLEELEEDWQAILERVPAAAPAMQLALPILDMGEARA